MSETTYCARCGHEIPKAATNCPDCGRPKGTVLTPDPVRIRAQVAPPSTIQAGDDPATGDSTIKVHDPTARSDMRRSVEGTVTLVVAGAGGVGKEGETRLAETLCAKLHEDGTSTIITKGEDDRGEDGIMRVDNSTLVVQMVTTPSVPDFWREASRSSASTQVDTVRAAEWLRTTITDKAAAMALAQRANTLLAVDARHAGLLATDPVLDEYTTRFGDPSQEYGFSSVWVVGPTPAFCARIGNGVP